MATKKVSTKKSSPQEVSTKEVSLKSMVEGLFKAFITKDVDKVMSFFAEDALFFDPHYPQQRMVGREAILQGVTWGLSSMEKPGFKIRKIWQDGNSGVVETDTHHVIKGGIETKFEQVFVFETRHGKFSRVQSYVPYSPNGIAGVVGNATRLMWKVQGKL
jgi:ketosteroid isomerase-like protein